VNLTPATDREASAASRVIFTAVDDNGHTGDREVTFEFASPGAGTVTRTFVVREDEPTPSGSVAVAVDDFSDPDDGFAELPFTNGQVVLNEGQRGQTDVLFGGDIAADATITITRTGGPAGVLTPDRTRIMLTPANDRDSSTASQVIFMAADDAVFTGDRTVTFEFTSPVAGTATRTFLVREDDPDDVAPTVTLARSGTPPETGTVTGEFGIVVTFSESVTGFAADDITVGNGSVKAGGFDDANAPVYAAVIVPTSGFEGAVTIDVAADAADDLAGNANTAATQLSVTADLVAPTVMIARADGLTTPVNGPFDITVTFSEPVTGFTADDLDVTNGTA